MTVDVTVGRLDLIRFNLSTIFKIRANWVMFFLLWAFVISVVLFESEQPLSEINYLLLIALTFVVAAGAFVLFLLS